MTRTFWRPGIESKRRSAAMSSSGSKPPRSAIESVRRESGGADCSLAPQPATRSATIARPTASRSGRQPSRNGEAGFRVRGVLGATARQRRDEPALAGREGAAAQVRDRELPGHGRAAGQPEDLELAALDLLGDRIAGEERDPASLSRGPLDRLARTELPRSGRRRAGRLELSVDEPLRARVGLAGEQEQVG